MHAICDQLDRKQQLEGRDTAWLLDADGATFVILGILHEKAGLDEQEPLYQQSRRNGQWQ